LEGVDVLYHESTYGYDQTELAEKYYHSTASQAALVALAAHVGKLLLGHYSSRYNDEKILEEEARKAFAESYLTNENDVIDI